MADLDLANQPAVQVLGGMLLMKAVDYFAGKFFRRGDELQQKIEAKKAADEAEKHADFVKLKTEFEGVQRQLATLATRERVDGVAKSHADQIEAEREARHELEKVVVDINSRLRNREGLQGEQQTNPGYKLPPELTAAIAKHKETPP